MKIKTKVKAGGGLLWLVLEDHEDFELIRVGLPEHVEPVGN